MKNSKQQKQVIDKLIRWGKRRPAIRAMLLTSSRANPNALVDVFSDYDVILVVKDIRPFYDDRAWLGDFGNVLVVYRDPIKRAHAGKSFIYVTQYEDGLKIDFTLWSQQTMRGVVGKAKLVDELDHGYAVLLDKGHLTSGLKPPTFQAFVPKPPSEAAYQSEVQLFFHESTYVAKHLWRGDIVAAKYNLDHMMKYKHLRRMLEWQIETGRDWSWQPGDYGRGLKEHLAPRILQELEETYVGAGVEDNWRALFATIELYRQVATDVAGRLGFEYPAELHERALRYLQRVRNLDQKAGTF